MAEEKAAEKQPDSKTVDLAELFEQVDEKAEQVKSETAKTDEKAESKAPSSGDAEDEQEETLTSKVEGLQKELARVRKNKEAAKDEVQSVREELARVQGQLETLVRTKQNDSQAGRMAQYTDNQLVQGQAEWEDEALEAHAALREARKGEDPKAVAEAQRAVQVAKATLSAIRQELLERTKRVGVEQAKVQDVTNKLVEEITDLYDGAYESFPELKNKDSELWQAGNEEFMTRPALMRQLGPLAELVAVTAALTKNPELIGGRKQAKAARKELLSEINDKAESAILKGGGKAKGKTATDFSTWNGEDFDKLVHKVKMSSS